MNEGKSGSTSASIAKELLGRIPDLIELAEEKPKLRL
jgi:hypothetical protein